MDLGVAGKTSLCACASAGIGPWAALHLAHEGVNIVISARGSERLEEAAAAIRAETGLNVTTVVADHGTKEGLAALFEACPVPDILLTCVSPPIQTPDYREVTKDDWHRSLAWTLLGRSNLREQRSMA